MISLGLLQEGLQITMPAKLTLVDLPKRINKMEQEWIKNNPHDEKLIKTVFAGYLKVIDAL